jgi:hypothetical protein
MKDIETGYNVPAKEVLHSYWKRWHVIEDLCKRLKWTKGIELGVKDGKTFLHILRHCKNVSMTGIDVWENTSTQDRDFKHEKNHRIVKRMTTLLPKERYKLIKGRTDEVHNQLDNKAYDFVFIDADHSVTALERDIELYEPKVTQAVIGHDIHFESVREAVWNTYGADYIILPNKVWIHYID